MENEPEKPQSSVTPPPDIPPPSTGSAVPPPNLEPPPPPSAQPMPDIPPPPPPVAASSEPPPKAKFDADAGADEEESVVAQLAGEAPFDSRLIAGIIDGFVAGILMGIVMGLSTLLGWLLWIGYMLAKDSLPFLDGQSIGKKLMKLRAVDAQGKSLSGNWEVGIKRNIFLAIPFLNLYEAYVLYQKKEQHLPLRRTGDDTAKTKVIRLKEVPAA
jgi:hypothetical protein